MANCYFALKDLENACLYWNKAIDNGYKYEAKWQEEFNIDDPIELLKIHVN